MTFTTDVRVLGQPIQPPEAAGKGAAELATFSALHGVPEAEVVSRVRKDLSDDLRTWREESYPGIAEPWRLPDPAPLLGYTGGSSRNLHQRHIGFGIDFLNDEPAAVAATDAVGTMVERGNLFGRFQDPLLRDKATASEALNRLAFVGFVVTPCLVRAARFRLAADLVGQTLTEFDRLLHDPSGDEMVGVKHAVHAERERGIGLCMLTDGILLTCLSKRWEETSVEGAPGAGDGFPGFRRRVVDAALAIDPDELGICPLHAVTRLVLGLGGLDERTLGWIHTYHEGLRRFGSEDAGTYAKLATWMESTLRGDHSGGPSDPDLNRVAEETIAIDEVETPTAAAKERRVAALARLKQANKELLAAPKAAKRRRSIWPSRGRGTTPAAPRSRPRNSST